MVGERWEWRAAVARADGQCLEMAGYTRAAEVGRSVGLSMDAVEDGVKACHPRLLVEAAAELRR